MKSVRFLIVAVGFSFTLNAFANSPVAEAAKKIEGNYTGTWAMYGIKDGTVVQTSTWTDVLIASNLTEEADQAYVEVRDIRSYPDGSTGMSVFHEGYHANADGSVGDRFFEINGQTSVFKKLTPNDWTYQATPNPGELASLGFDPKTVISASHVAIKTTTYENGLDTDHVTRVTTVQWKDATGTIQTTQFVSMTGKHKRTAD